MSSKKSPSPMKQMIKESLREIKNDPRGEFPDDPQLNEDEVKMSGPERFAKTQKQKDEVIVDRLLAPIAGQAGYFLKLKREMSRPGEWMLMDVIENEWRRWPDIEAEIVKIVRERTKKSPLKWGTGYYMIEFACNGGIRGTNYDPIKVHVNAEEEYIQNPAGAGTIIPPGVNPEVAVASRIEELTNLVNMLSGVLPKAPDPAKIQEQVAGAFKDGMALKLSEGSNSNQMMTAIMTGLIGMMTAVITGRKDEGPRVVNPEDGLSKMLEVLKNFGVLGQQEKQKTTIDFLNDLKAMGVELFKKENPIEQITQLKQLANIAGEFMGMGGSGERPGILEKIVDAIGPSIPGMIKDIKDTAGNAVAVQVEAGKNIERARQIPMQEKNVGERASNVGSTNLGTQTTGMPEQVQAFFNGLYEAVNENNRMFYPIIYTSLLQDANGQALVKGIVDGTHTAKDVIELLQQYGGDRYKESEFVMKKLVGYTNGFIVWIRELVKPRPYGIVPQEKEEKVSKSTIKSTEQSPLSYDAECPLCHTIYAFDSEQDFIDEKEKECGQERNGVICPGLIQPIVKAS